MIRQYVNLCSAILVQENLIKEISELILPLNQSNIIHYGKSNIMRQNKALEELKRIAEVGINDNKQKIEYINRILRNLDPVYCEVLKRKHINGEEWSKMAEEMNYSERHIHRIYNKALASFEMCVNRN